MDVGALILIAAGVLYLVKPDIFRRWIWTETSIAQHTLLPKNYLRYMRGLGVLFILIGLLLLLRRMR